MESKFLHATGASSHAHEPSQPVEMQTSRRRAAGMSTLAVAALGVVFGDIGTSPLYAFTQCFTGESAAAPTAQNIFGILSLIFYSLVVVVCIKYVTFLLRADYDGEGGALALLAQLVPPRKNGVPVGLGGLALLVLFGSSMLYGDGAITPAISVISAIEGIEVWTKAAHPFIVPLSAVILIGLFTLQSRGTGRIGSLFGPIMLVWFITIGAIGAVAVVHNPEVLRALDPMYALTFFAHNGLRSILIFGAVVLCVTGAEALYADLAHFGRKPITVAWYSVVFPALLLNYFGQGALALNDPKSVGVAFYALVPRWGLIPMVLLATVATVIASQALISGVFSITQQAMQLGYSPRFRIIHTSRYYAGQIYIPAVNVGLGIVCILLVFTFKSSAALGGAYGLAVTVTMLTTTITFARLLYKKWKWPIWRIVPLIALFLLFDTLFLTGNLSKVLSGGWVPLAMALTLFTLFVTWNRGRRRMMLKLTAQTMSVDEFLKELQEDTKQVRGTAIFLTPDTNGIPYALQHTWLRTHIIFENIVLLTIMNSNRPFVHPDDRIEIEDIAPHLVRVKAWYGFMQEPNIHDIVRHLRKLRPGVDFRQPTYYLASPKIRPDNSKKGLPNWQRGLFLWMTRNARPLTDSLGLPPNNIIEFGVEVRV
ncbi:MAG: potassium transporter Kup [Vulcanimicrobiaceae bacterium]